MGVWENVGDIFDSAMDNLGRAMDNLWGATGIWGWSWNCDPRLSMDQRFDNDPRWRGTQLKDFTGYLGIEQTKPPITHQWILTDVVIVQELVGEQIMVRGLLTISKGHHPNREFAGAGIGTTIQIAEDLAFKDALRNMRRCEALDRGEAPN